MARQISADISEGVKDLITQVTGFEEGSNAFNVVQTYFHEKLRKSDTMYFLNKMEVDKCVTGMAEKFNFHGFFCQSKALLQAYNDYIMHASKGHLISHLNVIKFLLCMSQKPTSKFLEDPEKFEIRPHVEVEDINWGEYLKEGIENCIPRYDDSTDYSDISSVIGDRDTPDCFEEPTAPFVISSCEKDVVMNLRANREELLNTIQHTWYNENVFFNKPVSERREANIAILWENYLDKQAMGLVLMKKSNVLTEYKVIREILWQLWGSHTSSVFNFQGNSLGTRDVIISSVRSVSFHSFIENEITPYIKLLDFFKDFNEFMSIQNEEFVTVIPQTYRSYNNSLQRLIRPVYLKLSELENMVREQESTYTLLNLSQDLQVILEPIVLLKKIHDIVVVDFSSNSNIICASSLLACLHDSLQYSVSKLDQDLRVTLYVESLYHYLTIIQGWFIRNDFVDHSEEFLITNTADSDSSSLNFNISDKIDKKCHEDGLLKIIISTVLTMGRNLHLLRLLGDFSSISESNETIFEEYTRKILEELCTIFDSDFKIVSNEKPCDDDLEIRGARYKFPVISSEDVKPTDMDTIENLVDASDGFLMLAFEDYFKSEKDTPKPVDLTLYEKISEITKTFFPVTNFFEKILNNILKERFTISGIRVKNILIEQYLLEKQFKFLQHTFLFVDNIIFPFYRRFFIEVCAQNKNWGNDIWLTSHFQDIIMDMYPEFYDKCYVQVHNNWKICDDPLEACGLMCIHIDILWPLNIIISPAQMQLYKNIFHFILKIKWGLHTLNRLLFTDLEPKHQRHKGKSKVLKTTSMKLKCLRFALINLFNSVHHYIFAFVLTKCLRKFELDFEAASDLSSIMSSHSDFIDSAYSLIVELKDCGSSDDSFESILNCVKVLKFMWENISYATPERLQDIHERYRRSFNIIYPIISPEYIFNY